MLLVKIQTVATFLEGNLAKRAKNLKICTFTLAILLLKIYPMDMITNILHHLATDRIPETLFPIAKIGK